MAERVAQTGKLVTFGIKPTAPETRFGYIDRGRRMSGVRGGRVFEVERFVEKPGLARRRKMLDRRILLEQREFRLAGGCDSRRVSAACAEVHAAMERLLPRPRHAPAGADTGGIP